MSADKHQIAVIGPKEIISGFRALGVEIFPANTPEQAQSLMVKLKGSDGERSQYAVILVTSSLLNEIPAEEYAKLSRGALPAITAIPDLFGTDTASSEKLKKLAERAIGSDILS